MFCNVISISSVVFLFRLRDSDVLNFYLPSGLKPYSKLSIFVCNKFVKKTDQQVNGESVKRKLILQLPVKVQYTGFFSIMKRKRSKREAFAMERYTLQIVQFPPKSMFKKGSSTKRNNFHTASFAFFCTF